MASLEYVQLFLEAQRLMEEALRLGSFKDTVTGYIIAAAGYPPEFLCNHLLL